MKPSVYALRDAILYWAGRPDATEEKILRTAEHLISVAPQGQQANLSLPVQGATDLSVEGARRSSRAPSTSL
jgi:hypothetical protein